MGHFSANSSSQNLHTFLLQFVVALVSTLVHSTGFIDTVVKWNVDVGLSHDRLFSLLANSFNNQESALEDYIQNSVMLQYNHC